MSLPVYQNYNLKSANLEDLESFLKPDLNLRHPIVINLKPFTLDQQRELIGLIENYYVSNNVSFKYPYPVYILSDHESTIAQIPVVQKNEELPKFFSHLESRMNVKETHVIGKNKLLQIEIKNTDSLALTTGINKYGYYHRRILTLERERIFYLDLMGRLTKVKKNG